MTGFHFVDTNILVYADDADSPAKAATAQRLLHDLVRSGRGVVSSQVLQEYFVSATRKLGVTTPAARSKVELLAQHFDVVHVDTQLILGAVDLHASRALSFWDALIVKAAVRARCVTLITEGLAHGEHIEGLVVRNPFV